MAPPEALLQQMQQSQQQQQQQSQQQQQQQPSQPQQQGATGVEGEKGLEKEGKVVVEEPAAGRGKEAVKGEVKAVDAASEVKPVGVTTMSEKEEPKEQF